MESMMMERTPAMKRCMDECSMCMAMCNETMMYCARDGRMTVDMMCVLQDCIDMCGTAIRCMMRMSPQCSRVCMLCAEMCLNCASMCEQMASGNELMMRCAEMCKRCAESCRMMSKATMAA